MFLLSLLRSRGMTLMLVVLALGAAGQCWRIITLENRNQRLVTQNSALIRKHPVKAHCADAGEMAGNVQSV
ncbi:hypothetical protein OQ483_24185 (plasmid) [Enterobacter bugandensis]|uniref:hypothetical protein n=1 Tax=Enterobacter bugandensis TaxID=881260 RepID=UPI00283A8D4C|nr:hypothetical protein [Enterobacter bugandensis]WMU75477.1 hypothetical protein OQ483_24185 [Enterobacter bugandensis]